MTASISRFVIFVLLVIANFSFANSSFSEDGVCSNAEDVGDFIWNIAIGDIDVLWGGSGWSDEVAMTGMDFFFVHDIDGDGNEDVVITDGTMPWEERVGPRTGAIYFNNGEIGFFN